MTFEQLLYFSEVYRLKSITYAAENLFISRPSLSRAIHRLEEEFDVVLFNRLSDGVEPTAAGHKLYIHAQNILREQNQLNQTMLNYSAQKAPLSLCKIGLSKLLSSTYAQQLLDTLSELFPQTYFDFFLCQKTKQQNFYQNYDISIILIPDNESDYYLNNLDPAYEIRRIASFPISIWISAESDLCLLPIISKVDLQNHSFCTLKNQFNMNSLSGVLGHDFTYYQNSQTVELERNFADKIEKFQYYTIDCPINNGDYLYKELFHNRQVCLKPTNEKFILEIIYRTDTCQDFYPSIANLFSNV